MKMRKDIKVIVFLCIGMAITNYLDLKIIRKLLANSNETIDGPDARILNNCYIIQSRFNGVNQWGNAVYFYMFSLVYLLRNGASTVIIKDADFSNRIPKPIGTKLNAALFGPNAASYNEKECLEWDPRLFNRQQGAMQDIMDFRRDWDVLSTDWPKDESRNMNTNPFTSDFGISPALAEVANTMVINWEEVIVLHIRQGDVMEVAYPPHNLFVHSQPPCSYYEDVIDTGFINGTAFPYLLIITNSQEDEIKKNPCDEYLRDKYSSDKFPTQIIDYQEVLNRLTADDSTPSVHNFLRMDLHILSSAVNLAEGHSTFTMGANMLNTQLKRHFVPANPSTINCVWPFSSTLNGNYVYTRQYYSEEILQVQYLFPDWFGFNPSCDETNLFQLRDWRNIVSAESRKWDLKNENVTSKMMEYPRSKLLKYKTTNEPFKCSSSVNPLITANASRWFIPCMCKVGDVIDHILSTE